MYVPSYQMHNVLNVYSNKLRRNVTSGKNQKMPEKPPVDRVTLTSEGKRRATIEKVSKDILDKITQFSSQAQARQRGSEQIKGKPYKESVSAKTDRAGFVFNVIDTINKKTTNTVSVEDSNFLIQRLDQLSTDMKEKGGIADWKSNEGSVNRQREIMGREGTLTVTVDNG